MEKYAQVNGIQLRYLDHDGGDPPIILMPGLTANAHSFNGLIQAGLSPQHRVLALDLRGRGLSDKPDTGYSMADHAADIIDLLDSLELEQVVLGGHSFGGWLTFYIAAHYPERVSKLIIIDVAAEIHPRTRELIQPSLDRLGVVLPSLEAYLDRIKQMPFLDGQWDSAIESFYKAEVQTNNDGTVQALTRPHAIAEAVEKAVAEPWADFIADVQHPTILFNAPGPFGPPETPPVLPEENARETVEAMTDCQYVKVPGNHVTMIFGEGAQQMVESIKDFIEG